MRRYGKEKMKTAVILNCPDLKDEVKESSVIYADGAYRFKDRLKDKKTLAIVGDFDSLGYVPCVDKVLRLEPEKNLTDGERAVRLAYETGVKEIAIYGAYGGKTEHILGNIALLKIANNLGLNAEIIDGAFVTELISGEWRKKMKKGGALSLIPYGGDCSFAGSEGLYYPLENLTLTSGDTRGISNVSVTETVALKINSGEALVIYETENL